jgi:hypothetical protein
MLIHSPERARNKTVGPERSWLMTLLEITQPA